MKHEERRQVELRLQESNAGYEILDMIAQANVRLDEIPLEQLDSMLVQFSQGHPKGTWRLPLGQTA